MEDITQEEWFIIWQALNLVQTQGAESIRKLATLMDKVEPLAQPERQLEMRGREENGRIIHPS